MSNKSRKIRLFHRNPRCYYCGVIVRIVNVPKGKRIPDDMATLEHLYSRLDYRRHDKNDGKTERTVLSCHKCNQERAKEQDQLLTIEEKWQRSGSYPNYINE